MTASVPAADPAAGSAPPARVLFVSGSGASATLRYRVRLPEEALRSRGVRTAAVHFTDPAVATLAAQADVLVLYRVPAGAELIALLAELRRRHPGLLVTYDVDDLVFRPEHLASMAFLASFTAADRAGFSRDVARRGDMLAHADLLTGSTAEVVEELGGAAGGTLPTALLSNGVGIVGDRLATAALRIPREAGGLRLGYFSGSATHDADWSVIEPVVLDFLGRHRDARLVLVGQVNPSAAATRLGDQLRVVDAVPWRQLPALLRGVDVNLAPLERGPFTDAKSAIKWLEAALVRTPTIATPTGPFAAAVEHGRTGFLAATEQDWADALAELAGDQRRRTEVGTAAREAALAAYGPGVQADRLLEVFRDGLEQVAGRAVGARVPPVDAQPARPVQPAQASWQRWPVLLERYPWPDALAALELPLPNPVRARDAALRAARLALRARSKGVRTAKRAVLRVVRGKPATGRRPGA